VPRLVTVSASYYGPKAELRGIHSFHNEVLG